MPRFSANLGFLWSDLSLPKAIHAAHAAGFEAVECHWPYEVSTADVKAALDETRLQMLGLNTVRGNPGENGLAALPGREAEARAATDQAIAYARATGTGNIHVMAGFAQGAAAQVSFMDNLRYACTGAAPYGITILVEPLNHHDAPGYFLQTSAQASDLIEMLDLPNLRLMFDCYHLQIMEGDLTRRLGALLPITGHIQIAAVPDRGAPDHGELDYGHMMQLVDDLGWQGFVGAEYKPDRPTDETLSWLPKLRGR